MPFTLCVFCSDVLLNLTNVKSQYQFFQGNWLRDYSQAMDIMGLTKVGKDAILVVVQAFSFMVDLLCSSRI